MEQKYKQGDRIRICRVGHPMWEAGGVYDMKPEIVGKLATVVGSYYDQYGGSQDTDPSYTLNIDDHGQSSWYHEYQMESEDTETPCTERVESAVNSNFHKQINEGYKKYMQEAVIRHMEEVKIEQNGTDEQKSALKQQKADKEYKNHLKWAWVYIGDKKEMINVHEENMKGYKNGDYEGKSSYYGGVKMPLEEQVYDKFDRWCTSFDL